MARNFAAGRRTDKQWTSVTSQGNNFTADGTSIASGGLDFTEAQTVMRCRGSALCAFNAATTALDEADITLGLGIFSTDAFNAGSASMPDPAGEPDYPWLWWGVFQMFSPFVIDGTGSDDSGALIHRLEIDTKAMRRVKPRQTLGWIAQYVDQTGTPSVRLSFAQTRVLVGR